MEEVDAPRNKWLKIYMLRHKAVQSSEHATVGILAKQAFSLDLFSFCAWSVYFIL